MSTVATLEIASTSSEDTYQVGVKLASTLVGGEVIQMSGDLGAGKTTFIRGLAAGLGSEDDVASPSFTISREYKCPGGKTLHHFDFYRLDDAGIMADELDELIGDPATIVAIEWSDVVEDVLPERFIKVDISPGTTADDRKIKLSIPTPEESA